MEPSNGQCQVFSTKTKMHPVALLVAFLAYNLNSAGTIQNVSPFPDGVFKDEIVHIGEQISTDQVVSIMEGTESLWVDYNNTEKLFQDKLLVQKGVPGTNLKIVAFNNETSQSFILRGVVAAKGTVSSMGFVKTSFIPLTTSEKEMRARRKPPPRARKFPKKANSQQDVNDVVGMPDNHDVVDPMLNPNGGNEEGGGHSWTIDDQVRPAPPEEAVHGSNVPHEAPPPPHPEPVPHPFVPTPHG